MIKTVRDNINLPYSLHDMSVSGFKFENDMLIIYFENGFVKVGEPCVQVDGYIEFNGVDLDFCFAYILDICSDSGKFTGEKLSLSDFILKYRDMNFEICDETYGFNQSKFSGYLSVEDTLKECVLEIYHTGDMIYTEI